MSTHLVHVVRVYHADASATRDCSSKVGGIKSEEMILRALYRFVSLVHFSYMLRILSSRKIKGKKKTYNAEISTESKNSAH